MNSALLVIIAVVILLLIVVIVVILKNLNSSKPTKNKSESKYSSNTNSSHENNQNNIDYLLVDLKDIELPKKIASLDNRDLFKACKAVFDSFKALDYKNSSNTKFSKSEWHSWQVSLLIAFQKSKREFHVGKTEDVFDASTLEMSKKALDEAIKKIWKKYNQNVNITLNRNALSNDIIWTSREVSTMLFYMMKTKY